MDASMRPFGARPTRRATRKEMHGGITRSRVGQMAACHGLPGNWRAAARSPDAAVQGCGNSGAGVGEFTGFGGRPPPRRASESRAQPRHDGLDTAGRARETVVDAG